MVNRSTVAAVESFILSERRVEADDVVAFLASRLGVSHKEVSQALKVLRGSKKVYYRRRSGRITALWCPRQSRIDRLDMPPEAKRQERYAKGVPSVTYGGEVASRHVKFDPRANGALSVFNECLGVLIDKAGKSGRVKNPEKLIAVAMRPRGFRYVEARCIVTVLEEMRVLQRSHDNSLGSGGAYTLDMNVKSITGAMYQSWIEGEERLLDEPQSHDEVESEPSSTVSDQDGLQDAMQMCQVLQSRLETLRAELKACFGDDKEQLLRAIGYVAGAQHRLKAVQDALHAASAALIEP